MEKITPNVFRRLSIYMSILSICISTYSITLRLNSVDNTINHPTKSFYVTDSCGVEILMVGGKTYYL